MKPTNTTSSYRAVTTALAIITSSSTVPRSACAEQPMGSARQADVASMETRAVELFRSARAALEKGRQTEACQLFRQSAELKTSPGILLNIGACLLFEGEPAQALEAFEHAHELAQRSPDAARRKAWSEAAQRELTALRSQLAEATLRFTDTPGLELRLNDVLVTSPSAPLWLKPGEYRLHVSAPEKVSVERSLTATAGARLEIPIPRLQANSALPPLPPPQEETEPVQVMSVLPWALLGTGAVTVGAGVVTGVLMARRTSELEEHCPSYRCPDPGWQDEIDSAKQLASTTGVLLGVGLATTAVGVGWLLFGGGAEPAPATPVDVSCLGDPCSLVVRGRF